MLAPSDCMLVDNTENPDTLYVSINGNDVPCGSFPYYMKDGKKFYGFPDDTVQDLKLEHLEKLFGNGTVMSGAFIQNAAGIIFKDGTTVVTSFDPLLFIRSVKLNQVKSLFLVAVYMDNNGVTHQLHLHPPYPVDVSE